MSAIRVILEGDNAWPDLADRAVIHLRDEGWEIACLPRGTVQGNPSLAIRLPLPEGKVLIAETTVRAFLFAADLVKAKYGSEIT